MPQSLIQMPETAKFQIDKYWIEIKNQKVENWDGLWVVITGIIEDPYTDRDILYQFEEHGISFETVIEECTRELKENTGILAHENHWVYAICKYAKKDLWESMQLLLDLSKKDAGAVIADQCIEKIRSCNNWGELYDELHPASKFSKNIMKKIKMEVRKMPQSLTRLPKTADFKIGGIFITIKNHKVTNDLDLLSKIMHIIWQSDSDRETLYQFENNGISYEAAIECCVLNLEKDARVLGDLIYHDYYTKRVYKNGTDSNWNDILKFSESAAGRIIADQLVEKIKSCDDWGELYDEMLYTSKFTKDITNRIRVEVKQLQ